MGSRSQYSQLLILLLAATHLILAAIADDGRPITLDGCLDKCGDISIPYPFGMTAECSLPGFMVTCDSTTNPPRALLDTNSTVHYEGERVYANSTDTSSGAFAYADAAHPRSIVPVELMNISDAKSEVWAYRKISSDCVDKASKHLLKLQATNIIASSPFLLSPGRNDLIGVGWNAQPFMLNGPSFETTSGYAFSCISYLKFNLEWAENGSCSGRGCCQVPLPSESGTLIGSFAIRFQRQVEEHTFFDTVCSYGMLVGRSWYNFSTQDMHGYEDLPKKHPRGVPFILDFGISTGSCTAGHGAGCSGNSTCHDLPNGKGYACSCSQYYGGNPYLPNGCQDIDECSQDRLNECDLRSTNCANKEGGYDCHCKAGMTRRDDKSCTARFPLPAKIIVGIAALVVAIVLMFMLNQILKLKKFYEQNGGPLLKGVKNIRIYTRKQLKKITNNYECAIGEGAFGQVYKGTLKDKEPVAIKKSIKIDEDMKKEFTDEVIIQSEMRHKNIVRLLGCCLELDVPMLVYEFVARGSLYDVLFKRRESVPVHTRLMIAIGSAEGLTYMHSAGERTIRHGDVKSANILLDDKFNPKVSDFGTSSLLARGKHEMTERVIGDMSYIDPIYMQQGIVTQKSDVYSFGIVLIELITRRAATYDKNRSYIANFVEACFENRARDFIDNDITNKDDIKLLEMVSGVAVECLKPNPAERLEMKEVEHQLRGIIGQSVQHGSERKYQGGLSPTPDDVALLN
ncbi:hypothetical protein ACQ4PT_044396 [Festuca glaucescens]